MMGNNLRVGVTSTTFSGNIALVKELEKYKFIELRMNRDKYPLSGDELIEFFEGLDGLIIGREIINEDVLKASPKVRVLSKFGVGLDNIDFFACKKHNVKVVYTEGVNKRSVAEQTLAFMIFLIRNLYKTSNFLKRGVWDKNGGQQLTGKVIGIIGVGNVGKDLIELLKPFKCRILVNDIIDQSKYYRDNGLIESTKARVFSEADVVTIHTPLTDLTKNLVSRDVMKKMKKSAFLINTARGAIVNQDDLKWALRNEVIAGAAVDVYETEPPEDRELLQLENFICTPHIGGNASEAIVEMGRCAVNNLVNFFNLK